MTKRLVRYLSQFTEWHPYRGGGSSCYVICERKFVPMPINRTTVNQILGKEYTTDAEVQEYFECAKVETKQLKTLKMLSFLK